MMLVMPTIQLCINFGVLHCFLAHLNPYHLFHPLDIKVGGKKGNMKPSQCAFVLLHD